jgi:hypothetical protein
MLQKFKITSCAFILVLFGLTLMTVSPVFAVDGDSFTVCDNMPEAASKLECFRDLARSLRETEHSLQVEVARRGRTLGHVTQESRECQGRLGEFVTQLGTAHAHLSECSDAYAALGLTSRLAEEAEAARLAEEAEAADDGEGGAGDPETRPSRVDVVRDYCGDDRWCVRETLYFMHLSERIGFREPEALEAILAAQYNVHGRVAPRIDNLAPLFLFVRGIANIYPLRGAAWVSDMAMDVRGERVSAARAREFNLRTDCLITFNDAMCVNEEE